MNFLYISLISCCIIIIIETLTFYYPKKLESKVTLLDTKKRVISIPTYIENGIGNGFASLIYSILIALSTNRCLDIFNQKIYTEYYIFEEIHFCNPSIFGSNINNISTKNSVHYKEKDICNANSIESNPIIIYSARGFQNCGEKKPKIINQKLVKFLSGHNITLLNHSIHDYLSYYSRIILTKIIKLKKTWQSLILDKYLISSNMFAGFHVRTFGFFGDLNEDVSISHFNLTKFHQEINSYLLQKIDIYLSSDSLNFKFYINKLYQSPNFNIKMMLHNISHSQTNSDHIDTDSILEMELLSSAFFLSLTSKSSYSRLIYLKNNNCVKNQCVFIDYFDKSLKFQQSYLKSIGKRPMFSGFGINGQFNQLKQSK